MKFCIWCLLNLFLSIVNAWCNFTLKCLQCVIITQKYQYYTYCRRLCVSRWMSIEKQTDWLNDFLIDKYSMHCKSQNSKCQNLWYDFNWYSKYKMSYTCQCIGAKVLKWTHWIAHISNRNSYDKSHNQSDWSPEIRDVIFLRRYFVCETEMDSIENWSGN